MAKNPFNDKHENDRLDQAAAAKATQERQRAKIQAIIPPHNVSKDVTEDVVTLLDAVASSLDWGSGLMNREDLIAWKTLAQLLDFDQTAIEYADKQIQSWT